jgi:hypothetical protein
VGGGKDLNSVVGTSGRWGQSERAGQNNSRPYVNYRTADSDAQKICS